MIIGMREWYGRFALCMNEMKIKSGTEYEYSIKNVYGYTNFSNNEADENENQKLQKGPFPTC